MFFEYLILFACNGFRGRMSINIVNGVMSVTIFIRDNNLINNAINNLII